MKKIKHCIVIPFLGLTSVKEALNHISKSITENESRELLKNLGIDNDDGDLLKDLASKLEDERWADIKRELEVTGRRNVVNYIEENTLITKGNFHGSISQQVR